MNLNQTIPTASLVTSTSLALGEAYMDGSLEIEGDLYNKQKPLLENDIFQISRAADNRCGKEC